MRFHRSPENRPSTSLHKAGQGWQNKKKANHGSHYFQIFWCRRSQKQPPTRRFQLVKEKKEKLAHYHDQIEKLANAVGAQR